jgi:hypothetical protein
MSAQFKYPEVSSKPLLWESPIPRDTKVFKQFRTRSFACTLLRVVKNGHKLDSRHFDRQRSDAEKKADADS